MHFGSTHTFEAVRFGSTHAFDAVQFGRARAFDAVNKVGADSTAFITYEVIVTKERNCTLQR